MPEGNSTVSQQAQILAALSTVPLNRSRLFHAMKLAMAHCKGPTRVWCNREDLAASFGDALVELEAKGFVDRTPHPLGKLRIYHITPNGWEALNASFQLPDDLKLKIIQSAHEAVNEEPEQTVA